MRFDERDLAGVSSSLMMIGSYLGRVRRSGAGGRSDFVVVEVKPLADRPVGVLLEVLAGKDQS